MDTNQTFKTNANIVEEWNDGYKLEVDLSANSDLESWTLDFNFPYTISEFYGVDLVYNGDGSYTINGQNNQVNLQEGQSIKPIFIVEDEISEAVLPEFQFSESTSTATQTEQRLRINPEITEDWNGGYRIAVDLTANQNLDSWTLDFNLPYEITEVYGVELEDNGDGSYTISSQNDLVEGESFEAIFIVEDEISETLLPEFDSSVNTSDDTAEPATNPPSGNSETETTDSPDTQVSTTQQGQFAYGEALQKNFLLYEANRSGDLGPDNRLEWRSDSTLNDGSDVGRDLEGGYFDAGDHVKFGQPMAATVNMLAWGGVEYTDAYAQSGQLDELREAVKWGTDYFLKAHETDDNGNTSKLWVQVGQGGSDFDHGYWGAPETVEANTTRKSFAIDPANPGSDVAASTSSALAAASMLFRGVDDAYADELLQNATALYEFAETYQGKYSDSVPQANPFYTSYSGYGDELASGAAWMYKATGEQSYLTKAENYFKDRVGGLGDWSWATDDHSYGAAVILARESDDPFFKGQVEGWLDQWINGGGNIQYTQGGFAHRAPWASVPLTGSAAYLAELYNDTVKEDSRYSDFANNQIDYILGDNPLDYSYMIGFGDNYPERPHHRGSAPNVNNDPLAPQQNVLYGAIVGGPEKPDDYSHNDRRDDFITNEVGVSYNAPIASALIQQYDNFGGDPLTETQLDELIGVDANGVGF